MKASESPWLLAVTPAMLLLAPVYAPFISVRHKYFYHLEGSATTVLVAVLLNLFVTWLLFAALLWVANHVAPLRLAFWSIFVAVLPWLLAHHYSVLMDRGLPGKVNKALLLLCPLFLVAVAVSYRSFLLSRSERIYDRLGGITALVSLSWMLTMGQLVYYAIAMRGINDPHPLHGAAGIQGSLKQHAKAVGQHSRMIWIIFDELGYDQLYARRPAGLAMPNFDALAAQSTAFTAAIAPGDYTEQVVPALLLGEPARRVSFTTSGGLLYQNTPAAQWLAFDPQRTVFADALQAGVSTAVAGWHNPYCRLLSPVLDHCFWSSRVDSATPDFEGVASLQENALGPARRMLFSLTAGSHGRAAAAAEKRIADLHIADVTALVGAADKMLADTSIGFLFVHLPVPHPAGIYDRRQGKMTDVGRSSYVDNLALADKVLGHLRDELAAHGDWDGATVLVMGDHAWRTKLLWEGQSSWTSEDQEASHNGGYDPRPAYLVKLPHQATGTRIATPFPTLRTRALFDQVLEGRMTSVDELQRWAAQP